MRKTNNQNGSRVESKIPVIEIKPFLRWAGSKRKILPQLAKFWRSDYNRYVEPFAGCAALFFKLQPTSALLGDLNGELIETYKVVRENPDNFHAALSILPKGERHYYQMRNKNPQRMDQFERAVRFVYLNRHCFNGIYRTNLKGDFNVPFGGQKPGVIPAVEEFRKCALLLERAELQAGDFGHVLRNTRKGDFVYMDPPYAVASRRIFREYGPKEFCKNDLERLSNHLHRMNKRGVHFVVSYADCIEAKEVLRSWNMKRIKVRRHVAGFVGARRIAYELLVTNID